jgi:hypothetical protein
VIYKSFLGGRFGSTVECALQGLQLSSVWEAYPEGVECPIRVGVDSCEPWFAQYEVVATHCGDGGVDGVFKFEVALLWSSCHDHGGVGEGGASVLSGAVG